MLVKVSKKIEQELNIKLDLDYLTYSYFMFSKSNDKYHLSVEGVTGKGELYLVLMSISEKKPCGFKYHIESKQDISDLPHDKIVSMFKELYYKYIDLATIRSNKFSKLT